MVNKSNNQNHKILDRIYYKQITILFVKNAGISSFTGLTKMLSNVLKKRT